MVNNVLKLSNSIRTALETTHKVTKLIKYSPHVKTFSISSRVHSIATSYHSSGVCVLCPTRWTVNVDSLASIIRNYAVLQGTWEEL